MAEKPVLCQVNSDIVLSDDESKSKDPIPKAEKDEQSLDPCGSYIDDTSTMVNIHVRKPVSSHECNTSCLRLVDDPKNCQEANPYRIPCVYGWTRAVVSEQNGSEYVTYIAPCGRRLRNIGEVTVFLQKTQSKLCIDLFTFDKRVNVFRRFQPSVVKACMGDIANKQEGVCIECVNSVDESLPDQFEYKATRYPGKGVNLNLDPKFLASCDCNGDCSDKSKCFCQQLTVTATEALGHNPNVGYDHRLLNYVVRTGIFECNSNCACSERCHNKVAQHGVEIQLQLFKTVGKGWGLRCLHDLPKGRFLCVYAGKLLTSEQAEAEGTQFGDKYFANLDYIEVVENSKVPYKAFTVKPQKSRELEGLEFDAGHSKEVPSCSIRAHQERRGGERMAKRKAIFAFKKLADWLDSDKPSESKKKVEPRTRSFFSEDECYVMDARVCGNIARFFNHSCDPNAFVQNVFVDTHDLRFPWLALFTGRFIPAGEEITWDYGYEVGSVSDREIPCNCGARNCRGRLL